MAVIGFIREEKITIQDKEVKWLECHFRVAGLRPFKAKFAKNKNKENNQPDYFIYLRGNINKGDSFRDIKIGGLWLKEKIKEDGTKEQFLTGNLEMNFKEISIIVQKPKRFYDNEEIGFLYEISAFKEQTRQVESNYENDYENGNYDNYQGDDEDIPF